MTKSNLLYSPDDRSKHNRVQIAHLYFNKGLTAIQIADHLDMRRAQVGLALDRIRDDWQPMSRMTEPKVSEDLYGMPSFTLKDLKRDLKSCEKIEYENRFYLVKHFNSHGHSLPQDQGPH